MYHNWNSLFTPPGAWTSVSCCYQSPTINQITIEIAVLDDSGGYWLLDDFSASQGRGQLISNGGFENNLTNWTLLIYPNATSRTEVIYNSGSEHSGVAYLYGSSINASVYIKQTFSIIPNENLLINFWWDYFPAFGIATGNSELTISLS